MIISSRISLNWIYVNVSIVSLFKINARIVSRWLWTFRISNFAQRLLVRAREILVNVGVVLLARSEFSFEF